MSHQDWLNFTVDAPPGQGTNKTNTEVSVPADTFVDGAPDEVTTGPRKVFKTGYPTSQSVGDSQLEATGGMITLKSSTDVQQLSLLGTHGVADPAVIAEVLHPAELSLLDSLIQQKAFLVAKDTYKTVDVADSPWPVDMNKSTDVRAKLGQKVICGTEIGIVAGVHEDLVLFKGKTDVLVPIDDVTPIMTDVKANDADDANRHVYVEGSRINRCLFCGQGPEHIDHILNEEA